MLRNRGEGVIESSRKECKPDYETMIKENRQRLWKIAELKNAILDYVGLLSIDGPLAEMVGELVQEERISTERIQRLIEKQEKEVENG